MNPLNVAVVGLRAPGAEGGVEQAVAALAPRLADRGCEITVFCRPGYAPPGARWRGVRLVDVPTVRRKHLEAIVHTTLSMPSLVRGGYDVVHLHAIGNALLSFVPRAAGIPTVVTVHGLDWKRAKWGPVARVALRAGAAAASTFADAVIAVSAETAASFDGAVRIPNGVDPIAFQPLSAAGIADLEPGYLLYVGRIVPEKDLETLIRAHAASGSARPLVIVGSAGHDHAHLDHLRGLVRSDVRFVGPRFGEQKAALLHHAAAFATASRLEGLPLALLEAMSAGRAVIASDIAPHRELVPDDRIGRRVPAGDVAAWALALGSVGRADGTGEAARDRAVREYGWDPVADRTVAVYRDVLARRRRS
jgi:glycosyltransferase involved in cell wall biosynthesis